MKEFSFHTEFGESMTGSGESLDEVVRQFYGHDATVPTRNEVGFIVNYKMEGLRGRKRTAEVTCIFKKG